MVSHTHTHTHTHTNAYTIYIYVCVDTLSICFLDVDITYVIDLLGLLIPTQILQIILQYHMYQFIPLHSCIYLKKISIKINVKTDEGNHRIEIGH